ncbi:AAA family ATPase [Sutcliffiella horikoshii]|uniref:AAA family ATPase n=1 Tax=Sutcliffiella horikoshii TaxID=79883 RepID=UPI001653C959|nr:AAA family ATPase [Sutcliffiella horikoshii]
MESIQQVRIKGFQSHVDSVFTFSAGLNVITGPSDSGKTALIRAARWVAFNDPQGEAFIHEAVGEAEVTIELGNGISITKRRRKGKTTYEISTLEQPFEKSEVPEEVKQVLGIVKQSFGDFVTALNFAFQLEAPFLISETASAGAKVLGKLAGTEAVDLAVKSVSKDTYAARQERTTADKEVESLNGRLLEYQNIDNEKEQLALAEMVIERVEKATEDKKVLAELHHIHELASEKVKRYSAQLESLEIVPVISEMMQRIEKSQQHKESLLEMFNRMNKATATVDDLTQRLKVLETVEAASKKLLVVESMEETLTTCTTLLREYQKYTENVNYSLRILEKTSNIEQVNIDLIQQELVRLQELKSLGLTYLRVQASVDSLGIKVDLCQNIGQADGILGTMNQTLQTLEKLKNIHLDYQASKAHLQLTSRSYEDSSSSLIDYKEELERAWGEVGGMCPLCEQPLNNHNHKERG